jgi:hypothetical protein
MRSRRSQRQSPKRDVEQVRALEGRSDFNSEGIRPRQIAGGRMNQDAGGGGLMEPSTDAPADSESSMPAGFRWTVPFSEQCHDAYIE